MLKRRAIRANLTRYRNIEEFVAAAARGEIDPRDTVSPGFLVGAYGISRQGIHKAMWDGRLRGWYVEGGYVFCSRSSAEKLWGEVARRTG